jgi:hypothetical protein
MLPPSLKIITPLRKLRRLRKLTMILNLLAIGIVYTILSFKRENELMFSLKDLSQIVEKDAL